MHDETFQDNGTATPPRRTVFQVREVTKVYTMGEAEVHALRSVNLDLYEGEFVVLLGPSGSGKSTLLNILGGLDVPSSGQVLFRHCDLTTADDAALTRFRRQYVGFVFQFYNLIPSLTARENVALVTEIASAPMTPEEALARVGLEARLGHFPAQLSGGEQQRTGALDFQTGKLVLQVIERINRELGTTTAVITHNAGIAAMADRVITLRSGQIMHMQRNATKVAPEALEW